jgi:hypothetical protein
MAITWVEFVCFEVQGFEEVDRWGDSTIGTTPAPPSPKETYVCTVIADAGADPED